MKSFEESYQLSPMKFARSLRLAFCCCGAGCCSAGCPRLAKRSWPASGADCYTGLLAGALPPNGSCYWDAGISDYPRLAKRSCCWGCCCSTLLGWFPAAFVSNPDMLNSWSAYTCTGAGWAAEETPLISPNRSFEAEGYGISLGCSDGWLNSKTGGCYCWGYSCFGYSCGLLIGCPGL